ncbi:hypothetical protein C8F04DRAFT_1203229 [Mycena alexandri]|uniref:Uncharacterized protein n=1 Tax=Mycena alexandri TaxID=1745969 RepID=A0AAD6WL04_9AGAR|nr:hypothetical protein C8F04DRAFT_1203229 [Mycena alexandri]
MSTKEMSKSRWWDIDQLEMKRERDSPGAFLLGTLSSGIHVAVVAIRRVSPHHFRCHRITNAPPSTIPTLLRSIPPPPPTASSTPGSSVHTKIYDLAAELPSAHRSAINHPNIAAINPAAAADSELDTGLLSARKFMKIFRGIGNSK